MSKAKWKSRETIAEIAEKSGLKYQTLYRRIKALNWDMQIALTTPLVTPRSYKKIIKKLTNGNSSR